MASNSNALSSHPQTVSVLRFCGSDSLGALGAYKCFHTPVAAQPPKWRPWGRYGTISLLVLMLAVPLGCTPPPPPAPPVARSFVYTPPEQPRQLLPITIALVHPSLADPARIADSPQWAKDTGNAFRSSMKTDLEKLLIAKGFKVTGPYDTLDAMTFPEKKGANLTLTPTIDIRAESKITQNTAAVGVLVPGHQEGMFVVGGWVALGMLEPLSGEKMWLKRVEIEPVSEPFVVTYNVTTSGGQRRQNTLSDTRPQALTAALNKIYPIVMQQTWTYFHPEEIMHINKQADEVRKLKRY